MARRAGSARRTSRSTRERSAPPARAAFGGANVAIYRNSVWAFLLFFLAVLVAFWPSYYSRLDAPSTYHPHAHGIAMTLWCALLIAQASLIRSGNRAVHRRLGRLSFALVPVMAVATVNFMHFQMRGVRDPGAVELYFMALVLNALVAFLAIYGLAMAFRRTPAVHARFMLCTIFPLFTPVTDRLIAAHVPSLVPHMPRIAGTPILPVAGFVAADVMLAVLSVWDWRTQRRVVFPVALTVLLLYHLSVLTFHRFDFWRDFGTWFLTLPLS
jgi:uncharacterized membrane protein YozB (DUF420 family)